MPKIVDVAEMKHQIMIEALHVFIRRGYHKTTFTEIARRCSIGRTTIYQYFKNKDEIFMYAVEHINQVFEEEYRSIVDDSGLDVLEKIKRIFSKFLLRCSKKNNEISLLLELALILKRDNHELLEQVNKSLELQELFCSLLEEGVKPKQIKPLHNMESMAFTLETFMDSLMLYLPFTEPGEMAGHLQNLHLIIDGLKA